MQSSDTVSTAHADGTRGRPVDVIPPLSLSPAAPSAKHSEDAAINVARFSAVTRESRQQPGEDGVQDALARQHHLHDPYRYAQSMKQTRYAPVQHFATGMEGRIIKIPSALGQSLEIFRQSEQKVAFAGMGWD